MSGSSRQELKDYVFKQIEKEIKMNNKAKEKPGCEFWLVAPVAG